MKKKAQISRRKFLWIMLLSITTVFLGALAIYDFNVVVVKMLKKDLAYLNIDESSFEKFVQQAQQQGHWANKFFDWKKQQLVRFAFMADHLLPSFPYKYKYLQYRSDIVGDFLLSTDFFINKMNTKAPVQYLGLYNPYSRPCSNPFSNLYHPAV